MIMGGNPGMLNMGPPGQRHPSSTLQPPGMGMSRGNQQNLNNIRGKNCETFFFKNHFAIEKKKCSNGVFPGIQESH